MRNLVLICVLMAPSACGVAVRTAEPVPAKLGSARCVAVLPFANATEIENAGVVMSEAVANELATSARFNVLEPLESKRILDSLGVSGDPPSEPELLQRLGSALGVEALLVGTVSQFSPRTPGSNGSELEPLVSYGSKLVDVASGEILWASNISGFDRPVLLGLPRSRGQIARKMAATAVEKLLQAVPDVMPEPGVCWKPVADIFARHDDEAFDKKLYSEYLARAGETLEGLAERFFLNPARVDLLTEANPDLTAAEPLRRGTRIRIPRFLERDTEQGETLASIAQGELGHSAYATLIYWQNRYLFDESNDQRISPERYGVVIDARQRWSLFDVIGSVTDQFVVVNGVPRIFPRVQTRLRWLVYGRKLPLKGRKPAVETFFENEVEIPQNAASWRLEIRSQEGEVLRVLEGDGAPPERLPWDGRLAPGVRLKPGRAYHYQLRVAFKDGTQAASPVEAFGAGVRTDAPKLQPRATISGRDMPIVAGRFVARYSTETFAGLLPVELVAEDGSSGLGNFPVPSVSIERPTRLEILEVGVSNDVYTFPRISVVDGRFNLAELDAADITFTLTGRTEPTNEAIVDGMPVELDEQGVFRATLKLHPGENLFSLLVRSPEGSQTFLEEQIVLRTRGPAGEPWEFAGRGLTNAELRADEPLPGGVELRVPLLRLPLGSQYGVREALFDAAPVSLTDDGSEAQEAAEPDGSG